MECVVIMSNVYEIKKYIDFAEFIYIKLRSKGARRGGEGFICMDVRSDKLEGKGIWKQSRAVCRGIRAGPIWPRRKIRNLFMVSATLEPIIDTMVVLYFLNESV